MNELNDACVLVILCKRPRLGVGKQRLAESIGPDAAYQIATALLACAMEDAKAWGGQVVISPASADDACWAHRQAVAADLDDFHIVAQSSGNLGERINQLDRQLRAQGYQKLLFMGTDTPMLTAPYFQHAKAMLAENDIVLSPADDGGLVLMGNTVPWPDMKPLSWSTDQLGVQVARTCQQQNFRIHQMMSGYDIDIEEDLYRVEADLVEDIRIARQQLMVVIRQTNNPVD